MADQHQSSVVTDSKPKGIIEFFAVVEDTLGEELIDKFLTPFSELIVIKIPVPQQKIINTSENPPVADHIQGGHVYPEFFLTQRRIACSPIFNDHRMVVVKMGARHLQGFKYLLLGINPHGLSRDSFDNYREKKIAGIAVEVLIARLKIKRSLSGYKIQDFAVDHKIIIPLAG